MPTLPQTVRRPLVLMFLVLGALAATAYWMLQGRAVEVADAPVAKIACVSYAPYRKPGETPFDPNQMATRARIAEDLEALSRRFNCVRTYSVGQGLDQVPDVARQYGMKVYLGIWLSRDAKANEEEMSLGIQVAKAHQDVVRAVVVGNEVLLRGELTQSALATYIRRVGAETGLPVTYADVWEFWLRYREVEKAVSFVTIHILPYWEDEPVRIEDAVTHVRDIRARMQKTFPDKEFLIGETGWPSQGRQRWGAVPSLVNEARFVREFLNWAEKDHVQYNVIEAFDQPWKRQLEGTVGGYWGVYDADLNEKFKLTGPVTENARWFDGLIAGAALGLLCWAGAWRRRPGAWGSLVLIIGGYAAGAMLYAEVRHFTMANRTTQEWVLTCSLTALALLSAWVTLRLLARWADGAATDSELLPANIARLASGQRLLGLLQFAWLFAATVMDLLLVLDARYRDFPTLLFAPAVGGFLLLAVARTTAVRPAIEERMTGWWLIVASVLLLVLELPVNLAADAWILLCLLFAASTLGRAGLRWKS